MEPERPVLYLGLDLGIRHDSAALVATYRNIETGRFKMWGNICWDPKELGEIRVRNVTEAIIYLFQTQAVAGLWYDHYQFISEAQYLQEKGYTRLLHEVNEQSEATAFANTYRTLLVKGEFEAFDDDIWKKHHNQCSVEVGERGWRIVKMKQIHQIDLVIATAMSLYGAVQMHSTATHPAYTEAAHNRSLFTAL